MTVELDKVTVFYDGSCPGCIRDRRRYEKLAGDRAQLTEWVDITGREAELVAVGINPDDALRDLHVRDERGRIHRELDAYILLMQKTRWLKPLATIIGLPGIRPVLAKLYHWRVDYRLRKTRRI